MKSHVFMHSYIFFAWKVPTTALLILHQLGSASILSIFVLCLQNSQQTAHSERSLGSELLESRNSMVIILQTNSVVQWVTGNCVFNELGAF